MKNSIRFYRKIKNIKAKEIADYLNISISAYSALENGKTKIDIERAQKLSKLFLVNIEEIFTPPPGFYNI